MPLRTGLGNARRARIEVWARLAPLQRHISPNLSAALGRLNSDGGCVQLITGLDRGLLCKGHDHDSRGSFNAFQQAFCTAVGARSRHHHDFQSFGKLNTTETLRHQICHIGRYVLEGSVYYPSLHLDKSWHVEPMLFF